MYSDFLKFFNKSIEYNIYGSDYRTFIIGFGGVQFGGGLFTVFAKADIRLWEEKVADVFPKYKGNFLLFGHDWMGRCYAIDRFSEEEKILIFDPGTLEVYDIPLKFRDFVNKAIPMNPNECLAIDGFMKWHNTTKCDISDIECVSYKVPPFLGGAEEIENLETSKLIDYWKIIGRTAKTLRGEEVPPEEVEPEEFEDGFFDRPYNDEDIDLMPVEDVEEYANQLADEEEAFFELQQKRAEYIKRNVDTYLEKFKKMHRNNTKISWNWCAFLFGGTWFLYRKMYKCFILTYLVIYAVAIAIVAGGFILMGEMALNIANWSPLIWIGSVAIGLFIGIVIGLFSDSWYRNKVDKLVARGDNAQTDEEWEKAHKKGGTNIPLMIIFLILSIVDAASIILLWLYSI